MKNIKTIFKKEFYRVMSDKRLIFTAILLPGLAIYIMYSFIGNTISNEIEDIEAHVMNIHVENMPTDYGDFLDELGYNIEFHDYVSADHDALEQQVLDGDIDLILIFEPDFQANIDNLIVSDVFTYYNSGERYSEFTFNRIVNSLYGYGSVVGEDRYGDAYYVFSLGTENIVDEDRAAGQGFAMLLPMIIIMFLFTGAMSIGPDSIAGEKERGTIATLLVTPTKRSEIAIGKVLSLSVVSMFSATSSFIGIMFSLPKLMQGEGLSVSIYGIGDFLILFSILLATVFFIVGLISVISAYAKSIKEASLLIMPFYFASIVLGMSTMLSGEANSDIWVYFMPIYSSVNMIISILTFEVSIVLYLITIVSNLVYVSIFIYILNKFFQSEKIMFSK